MAETKANRAGFEESFNKKVLTHGRILVNQLAILVKVAQMHDLRNVAVEKAAETLLGTLRAFFEDQTNFSLVVIGDYLFLEDNRIKYNVEDFNNFDFLISEFKKRKLGTLNFQQAVATPDLLLFVSAFLNADQGTDEVYQAFARKLGEAGVSGIATEELKPPKVEKEIDKVVDTFRAARRAYIRVLLRVKELYDGIEKGQPADIRKLKRAVQSLVDSVYKNRPALLMLSAIRREEDVLPRHYTNVCVLSLCIGAMLGLSKYQMARLGMAALLHDIGRQGLPDDLLERAEEMDTDAVELLNKHPRLGVLTLLRLKGLNEVAVSAMIVAYEHHRNLDGTGYPEKLEEKDMNLFSMIVRVADHYDATTSSGIYGRIPMPPEKALSIMLGRAGRYFDREVLSLFVKVMGLYPVGSLLLLSDGSLAVVNAPAPGEEGMTRPRVTIIKQAASASVEVVELTARDQGGAYLRNVVRSLDPYEYRVNVYRYLL